MNKNQLGIKDCHLQSFEEEQVLQVDLQRFPFDKHIQWLNAFCELCTLEKGESEASADLTLSTIYFEKTVFILHINDLVESIWISSTLNTNVAQSQLKRLLQHINNELIA
jgi:hypothetical protein